MTYKRKNYFLLNFILNSNVIGESLIPVTKTQIMVSKNGVDQSYHDKFLENYLPMPFILKHNTTNDQWSILNPFSANKIYLNDKFIEKFKFVETRDVLRFDGSSIEICFSELPENPNTPIFIFITENEVNFKTRRVNLDSPCMISCENNEISQNENNMIFDENIVCENQAMLKFENNEFKLKAYEKDNGGVYVNSNKIHKDEEIILKNFDKILLMNKNLRIDGTVHLLFPSNNTDSFKFDSVVPNQQLYSCKNHNESESNNLTQTQNEKIVVNYKNSTELACYSNTITQNSRNIEFKKEEENFSNSANKTQNDLNKEYSLSMGSIKNNHEKLKGTNFHLNLNVNFNSSKYENNNHKIN